MFIVCNYLDVENKNERTDGFVVEECSVFDQSLSDYVVVCREHRIPRILQWAQDNMGSHYPLFEKQFSVNKTKAMLFVKAKGGITSFTEELVQQAGGLSSFMEVYCKSVAEDEDTGQLPMEFDTDVEEDTTTSPSPSTVEEDGVTESFSFPISEPEPELRPEPEMVLSPVMEEQEVEIQKVMIPAARVCPGNCIYNTDGTFRGFTEGQVITMLTHLKELDKRIALDSLDPEYVLTKEQFSDVLELLDSVSPNVYKAFIMFEAKSAVSEIDRIRVSGLLDKFSAFLATLNK